MCWSREKQSHPCDLGDYWLIILLVNFAWWSHLLLPSLPSLGHYKEERTQSVYVSSAHSLATALSSPPAQSSSGKCLSQSRSLVHTAQREENLSIVQHVLVGICLRYRAQFPVWKLIHSWESKIHTTFCRNLMGNYVWGNFRNLSYANSLFDCNANPWSVLLPCLL